MNIFQLDLGYEYKLGEKIPCYADGSISNVGNNSIECKLRKAPFYEENTYAFAEIVNFGQISPNSSVRIAIPVLKSP